LSEILKIDILLSQ